MRSRDLEIEVARLRESVTWLDRLTDEKFVKFRTLIDGEADKVRLALDSAEKAITKADTAAEKRFDSVNEFRAQLADQANTFIPRKEAEQRIQAVVDRLDVAREQVAAGDQKLDERLKALETGSSNLQGRIWALGATIAAVVVLVNIAIALLTG